jgi:hypothetical protein
MRKKREKKRNMSLDQQIQIYEDRINRLEQMKQILLLKNRENSQDDHPKLSESDINRIDVDLDQNYEHIAILKIRKMMGFL